ncbi:hypothetical protein [Pseudarthrobacter sp. MEB009]|uniref:hypothetical protein n=1 Tax=Pseudarthrobacter sp. MEB009 TaxID=3040326 RepID=UPI002553FFC6|nr:hypothetical protein [Pseudarthrobacter sp. MEB009]
MTGDQTKRHPHRTRRLVLGLLLLAAIASTLVLLGPGFFSGLRLADGSLVLRPECVVETTDGQVGLTRGEAKRATSAVALQARGIASADTSGIDEAVLERLADGPPADAGPALTCRGTATSDLQEQQLGAAGLTPRAETLRGAMSEAFGEQSLGGFAPGGVGQGHGADSTHYDGRAIDIFFRPVTEENRRQGWILAHWLVAHAQDLDIQYVIFDDRFWSAHSPRGQWGNYDAPEPGNEILRHLDHVHVDVLGGSPS